MASKKKKKYFQQPKTAAAIPTQPKKEVSTSISSLRFALLVTGVFFAVAFIGILTHEMWRDEHQAWLVARDANSLSQLLANMNYEGNPALWHFFLFLITRVTHDVFFMQIFHLLVATSFIFIFNRYAPLGNLHKVLFSFGYFALYEYAVISRSYALGILLVFAICALYKNRTARYIVIGVLLALLANVTIYAVVISCCLAGILVLDHFLYQQKNRKTTMQLAVGVIIFILGTTFSLYQIWPEKDNSFPAEYANGVFDFERWGAVFSRLFTTYLYIPEVRENFWNTNVYIKDMSSQGGVVFASIILFIAGIIIFLRKPMIMLLYTGSTLGLFAVYYYTGLLHYRYCGYLLIVLISCFWLASYYPEKKNNGYLAGLGKRISKHFLTVVLGLNVIGAIIAYSMEVKYKFSTSKEVANYITENKLDSLPIIGITDFTISPLAGYLDKKIFYPQMNDEGSFTTWSSKRQNSIKLGEVMNRMGAFMDKGKPRALWITDQIGNLDKNIVRNDLQLDLLKNFESGIVVDEKYYVYIVQKVDPSKVDYSRYKKFN